MKTHDNLLASHRQAAASHHHPTVQARHSDDSTPAAQRATDAPVHSVDHSPRQVVQRQLLGSSFGPVAQLQADEQAVQRLTPDSSTQPIQRTVWEWTGRYWHAVRTEGNITPQPGHPGAYVKERISTGVEDPWGKAPAREDADEQEDVEEIPTQGGMAEDEARAFADKFGWEPVSTEDVTCSDPTHTPKGKVYTNGKAFYGADNTGHAGYGFKVWTREKGNRWKYCGNLVWGGAKWKYNPRGTE